MSSRIATMAILSAILSSFLRSPAEAQVHAELLRFGHPLEEHYTPSSTKIQGQVHELYTLPDGNLAVLHNEGLHIFNGTDWSELQTKSTIYSLLGTTDKKLYAAGDDGLYEIAKDPYGTYQTVPLFDPHQRDPILSIAKAREHIFAVHGTKLTILLPSGELEVRQLSSWSNGVFSIADQLFILGGGKSVLHQWDWEKREFTSADRFLYKAGYDWFLKTIPRATGGVWIQTREKGIFGFDGEEAWVWPGTPYLLENEIQIECLTELEEGRLAIGTSSKGIIAFDTNGSVSHKYATTSNDAIQALAFDMQGGLWSATRTGLSRYESKLNTLIFDRRHGIPAAVKQVGFANGTIYLATEAGAYRSNLQAKERASLFKRVPGTHSCKDLIVVGDEVIIGGDQLWHSLQADQKRHPIAQNISVNCLIHPKSRTDVILAGTTRGVYWATRENGYWQSRGRIEGGTENVYAFAETSNGSIWCTLGQEGIRKLSLDSETPILENIEISNRDSSTWYVAAEVENELYINSTPQLTRWSEQNDSFEAWDGLEYYGGSPPFGFDHVFARSRKYAFVPQSASSMNTVRRPSSRTIGYLSAMGGFTDHRANCIRFDDSGAAWIGSRFGLMYDQRPYESSEQSKHAPEIVRLIDLETNQLLPLPAQGEMLILPPEQNSIGIEVAYQSYANASHHDYYINLEDRSSNLRANTNSSYREFTNIEPGHHTITATVRDSSGTDSETTALVIHIQTPFSRTKTAFALYFLTAVTVLLAALKLNSLRHIRYQRKLESEVEARTLEISEKNEQLEHRAEEQSTTLTILKETQQQLLETARKAGKSQIASDIVHEIGQSLNSVYTSINTLNTLSQKIDASRLRKVADLLKREQTELHKLLTEDPRGKLLPEFLDNIALSLSGIVGDIVSELSSLEKDANQIQKSVSSQREHANPVHLIELINLSDLCATATKQALESYHGEEISVAIESELEIEIMTDRGKVTDILTCLLEIAAKSIDTNSSPIRKRDINITVSLDSHHATVEIEDTGQGFEPQGKQKLFRIDNPTTSNLIYSGLHKAANYATSLNGTLDLQSDGLGEGTTAVLSLPLSINT